MTTGIGDAGRKISGQNCPDRGVPLYRDIDTVLMAEAVAIPVGARPYLRRSRRLLIG